jgi:ATP-dependent DNA ligase
MKSARTNPTDTLSTRRRVKPAPPPAWIKPQLAALAEKAPDGSDWLHEIKLDGYRMHARLDAGRTQILTRRGNDWTEKYPTIAKSIAGLPARNAYLDGELCGVRPDGTTAFNLIQNTTDTGEGSLVFFLFDLLHLDGGNMTALPLVDRKTRLASLLHGAPNSLRYNDHQIGHGPAFHRQTLGMPSLAVEMFTCPTLPREAGCVPKIWSRWYQKTDLADAGYRKRPQCRRRSGWRSRDGA